MLIGMRNAMMAGGGLSAKSYVQDGLVAMWDGIENAGWGVHDPNATVWKDLVGDCDLTINHGSWDAKSFVCDTGSTCGAYSANAMSPVVAEMVFRVNSSSDTATYKECHVIDLNSVKMLNVILNDTTSLGVGYSFFTATSPRQYVVAGRSFAATPVSISVNYTSSTYRLNSVAQTVGTQSATVSVAGRVEINGRSNVAANPKCWTGNFNTLRLYSRALTAAEIAANYAVDKARFNLPDAM